MVPAQALGQLATHVTGGEAGTFGQDLDGDGDLDGSRFGVGAADLPVEVVEAGRISVH
jgi:hypothetical protein